MSGVSVKDECLGCAAFFIAKQYRIPAHYCTGGCYQDPSLIHLQTACFCCMIKVRGVVQPDQDEEGAAAPQMCRSTCEVLRCEYLCEWSPIPCARHTKT